MAMLPAGAPAHAPADAPAAPGVCGARTIGESRVPRRRRVPASPGRRPALRDWLEIIRPFSLTASLVPACVGAAVAWSTRRGGAAAFGIATLGAILLQAGTNVLNEVYDVESGVDTLQTPRASRVVVTGRLPATVARRGGLLLLALGVVGGAVLSVAFRLGAVPFALGLAGALAGYAYTAPPWRLKYRGLGVPAVAVTMGPLMVLGAEYVEAGRWSWPGLTASLPVACLVAAILIANDLRDADSDARAGIRTVATLFGRRTVWKGYLALVAVAYAALAAAVAARALPWPALLALLSAPLAARTVADGARPPAGLARLDQETAATHLLFGLLLTAGLGVCGLLAVP